MSSGQNQSPVKTIIILGPHGVGKATTVGNMIYKCGGIDLVTMEKFQRAGLHAYDQVVKQLRALDVIPSFMTPKHKVIVLDANASQADCAILILNADTSVPSPDPFGDDGVNARDSLACVRELIVLVNKMWGAPGRSELYLAQVCGANVPRDTIAWSEEKFNQIVQDAAIHIKSSDIDVNNVPFIPISGLHGDNLIEPSSHSPWYTGWIKGSPGDSRSERTLLEAIDSAAV